MTMRRPNGQAYFYLVPKHQLWTFIVIRFQNNEIISIVKELMRLIFLPSISGFPSPAKIKGKPMNKQVNQRKTKSSKGSLFNTSTSWSI